MPEETALRFGPFRLDVTNESVWRGPEACKLTRKAWAVLRYLVEHAGQLVTKEALFTQVWPEVVVGDAALTVSIRELRQVLGDDPKAPQYIETVYGRGYRFIAAVGSSQHSGVSSQKRATGNWQLTTPLVGREAELEHLHGWLEKARSGERQLVFVTGEPGIGKTTLIDAFLQRLASRVQEQEASQKSKRKSQKSEIRVSSPTPNPQPLAPVFIGCGQCIDLHGAGEPYLPILTAFEQLCRESGHKRLLTLLRQHAPMWLVQLPSFLSPEERERLQRELHGTTRERMLREMVTLLEVLTVETPLVLVLEDLHWSDPSTLDLLALVARRRETARLLIIGTYRPSEIFASEHPLCPVMQELLAHQQCQELALEGLSEVAVEAYVEQLFPVQVFPTRFVPLLHQRTEGNPLFLVNLVEDLVTHGFLTDGEGGWMVQGDIDALVQQVPDTSRQLITAQMTRLNPATQQTLAAASVAGTIFSAAAVAAALDTPVIEIETRCEEAAQQQLFLKRAGIEAWSDGTTAARYGFRHALYQELWHEQGTINQRQEWHQRIGLRKELAYNGHASEIATELAVHFEQGRDYPRTVHYLEQAGKNANQRSAYTEAIQHLTRGLELLKTLPNTVERDQQELSLQIALGAPLIVIKGYSTPEVEQAYNRARDLCRQLGDTPQLFPTLYGLTAFSVVRGELQTAHELSKQLLRLAHNTADPALLVMAHRALGTTLLYCGEFMFARAHFEQGLAGYDTQLHRSLVFRYGVDPKGVCLHFLAQALWYLGYPVQALQRAQEAWVWTQDLARPYDQAGSLYGIAWLYQNCGDVPVMRAWVDAAITLSTEQGFVLILAMSHIFRGWMLAEGGQLEEGITEMNQGFAMYRAKKANSLMPYHLALLGEVHGKAGQAEAGLGVLAEALEIANRTGECQCEAELYRLKGELTLQQFKVQSSRFKVKESPESEVRSPESEAEACFHKAIEIARKQQAKSLELRAVMSLVRLRQQQAAQDGSRSMQHETRIRLDEAHQMLSAIYNWFTEGFDTKDLQEAKALLEELGETGKREMERKDKRRKEERNMRFSG